MDATSQKIPYPSDFFLGLFYALSIRGFYQLPSSGENRRSLVDSFARTADCLLELGNRHNVDVHLVLPALQPHSIYHDLRALNEAITTAHLGGLIYFRSDKPSYWFINERSRFPSDYDTDRTGFFLAVADYFLECYQSLFPDDQPTAAH